MHKFTFNGKSSSDFSTYISGSGTYDAPKRDVSTVEIPGRNGSLTIDNGRYENIDLKYPAFIRSNFKANTDAHFTFDRKFSRCLNNYRDVFEKCIIWATAPILDEYYRTTNAHLVHPNVWIPFAPSGIKKSDVCIWQYGKECHPICDEIAREITFNTNLVKSAKLIVNILF